MCAVEWVAAGAAVASVLVSVWAARTALDAAARSAAAKMESSEARQAVAAAVALAEEARARMRIGAIQNEVAAAPLFLTGRVGAGRRRGQG